MSTLDPEHVVAIVPCHAEPPERALLEALRAEVGAVALVDDGMPAKEATHLRRLAAATGAVVVRLPRNAGKGHALRAGIRVAASRGGDTVAVLTVDADGQHPPAAIPHFLAAADTAELVIGDRLGDARHIPPLRRAANRVSSRLIATRLGRPVPDSQCGMRLLRGRALEIPFPGGGMEAETRHLVRCVRAGVPVRWVPIPAIYAGEVSAFRPVRDSLAVLTAGVLRR